MGKLDLFLNGPFALASGAYLLAMTDRAFSPPRSVTNRAKTYIRPLAIDQFDHMAHVTLVVP